MSNARVINCASTDICVKFMLDGQVGIITNWEDSPQYVGRIVQRHGDDLITINAPKGNSWPRLFHNEMDMPECRVRILPKGTKIELT